MNGRRILPTREMDGMKWKHFGCPKCGYIASLPARRDDAVPWCVHGADSIVWPWFVEDPSATWLDPMVPILVFEDVPST